MMFLKAQRTRYIHLVRFRKAHLFFCARAIFLLVAEESLYPPRLRPEPVPFNAVIAARTRSSCCSSFDASRRSAWTMFMNPPALYYHKVTGITEGVMASKAINKGCSFLNAADETANPYGLILSEKEREFIYGELICLNNVTNALLYGKTGLKQQIRATASAVAEFAGVGIAAVALRYFTNASVESVLIFGLGFIGLQKLNLLLTHEKIEDTHARRQREDEKEARERAQYFKDMGCKDMSLEE